MLGLVDIDRPGIRHATELTAIAVGPCMVWTDDRRAGEFPEAAVQQHGASVSAVVRHGTYPAVGAANQHYRFVADKQREIRARLGEFPLRAHGHPVPAEGLLHLQVVHLGITEGTERQRPRCGRGR